MDYGRQGNYYGRGRSPSPRDRFRHDGSRGRDNYGHNRDQDWSRGGGRRAPERYSASWRRDSAERSPRGRYRSKSRSPSRDRERSGSRGRGRYPAGSRSPKRRSSRRSSSYGSRKRFRKGSSSSSGSSSDSRPRSNSPGKKQVPKEDFFNTMYADREEEAQTAYLHPALNRSAVDVSATQSTLVVSTQNTENATAHTVSNTAGFAALSQAYGGNSPKKSYAHPDTDDEDRFLYGDEETVKPAPVQATHQPEPEAKPNQPASADNSAVTPGGFDSNALKNVLKAIGFDFEMSAQQSQGSAKPALRQEPPAKPAPPTQPPARPPPRPQEEEPQRIQTIGTIHTRQPVQTPTPVQHQPAPQQQYYPPYDPYNPESYPPQPVQPPIEPQSAPLGYPITIQDPNNPGNTLIVYRPANPPPQPQVMYQHQSQPQIVPPQQGGRVVLPPQRQDSMPEVKKTEKEIRQERLNYLQAELEKLKKQQNELLRKKRREKDGHKDPLIKKNTMLQAGVEEEIREIRQAAERAAEIESESSDEDDVEKKEDKEGKYNYLDTGNHWCRLCNVFSEDLAAFLSHLHSKTHRKTVDPYDRPWDNGEKKKKQKPSNAARSKPLKGSEFLIPLTGYYCKLCQAFSGDQMCADDHLKSYAHNATYKKYCKKNSSYEKKYKKKKKAALESTTNGNKKKDVKQEPTETEVKFVAMPIKIEKDVQRYVEKEVPRYVEKEVPRYVEKEATRYVEKVKSRYVEKEVPRYVEKGQQRYIEKEAPRYAEQPIPRYAEKEMKFGGNIVKYPDQQVKYTNQPIYPDVKPFGVDKHEKKHKTSRERSQEQSMERGSRERQDREKRGHGNRDEKSTRRDEERKPSKKYSDEYAERPRRTSDHGRRKKGWSPGYDEYERQQQDDGRHDKREKRRSAEKCNRRSRSRDRGERWVEKPPEDMGKKSDRGKFSKESIAAGTKIPTPGFGKFSWNSGLKNDPGRFDQVPVDNLVPSRETIDNKNGEFSGKGKIAIKITGKTHYPPRLSTSTAPSSKNTNSRSAEELAAQEKRAAMAVELQRKVEALKRENSLRNQLSSITLPSGRTTKHPPRPNTAAVMLGTRSIGKHNTLLLAKRNSRRSSKKDEEILTQDIEADMSPPPPPEGPRQPPPPGVFEPPPPGEEEIQMGDIDDDGAKSEASGISMELASDED